MLSESSSSVLVNASPEALFSLLSLPLLRLQLAPDWGEYEFLGADPDFPAPGSAYRLKLKKPAEILWEIGVQAYEPPRRLVFASRQGPHYTAEWLVEPDQSGSRLSLVEQIELPDRDEPLEVESQPAAASQDQLETYLHTAPQTPRQERQKLVTDWVASLGRYAGLPNSRLGRAWRRVMDRYLLRLRADQRRIILAIIAMQVVMCLTFIAAAVGLGVAGALLR